MHFVFRHVNEDRVQLCLDFHKNHIGPYLWPRTLEQFEKLANELCLFEVVTDAEEQVAICYVNSQDDDPPEFGGIYVNPEFRGYGVATFLGQVAIANFVLSECRTDLIAHVHVENDAPRNLLERIGFEAKRKVTVPKDIAPDNMAKNERDEIVGDEFDFSKEILKEYADSIEECFSKGQISGPKGPVETTIELPFLVHDKTMNALRQLSVD